MKSLLLLAAFGLLAFAGVTAMLRATIGRRSVAVNRARSIRWRIRLHMRPGPGYATVAELLIRWSRTRAVFHGRRARPGMSFWLRLTSPATDYAVRLGRAQWGRKCFARMEDQELVIAAPRVGKTGYLADRIVTHPGPAVCTSTRADLYQLTAGERSQRGPVEVFNPAGTGGVPSTLRWDIVAGCDDPAIAVMRADSLTGAVGSGEMAWWSEKAGVALGALLHAAALIPGATIMDVFSWCNRYGDADATKVLGSHPDASRALLSTAAEIMRDAKYADSIRMTMSKSLGWVAVPALAAAATPGPGATFDPAWFAATGGTVYMIASDSGSSMFAPLFGAFASYLHYELGMLGSLMPAGKLDPPALFALDEAAQVCPVPLPQWMSDSAGKGILICAVAHGMSQLEERWERSGAATIWATSGTKVVLGGLSDSETLEEISRLCGNIDVAVGSKKEGTHRFESVQLVPPEVIRQLPDWRALVVRMNLSPAVVKVRPVWKRMSRRFGRSPVPVLALRPPGARPEAIPADREPVWPVATPERAAAALADELAARRAASPPPRAPRPTRPPTWVRDATDG